MWQTVLSKELDDYIFTNEIPQTDNINANARLWIQPDDTVLKQYVVFDDITKKNIQILTQVSKMRRLRTIEQLVLPLHIVYTGKDIVGYTMPYCSGITLEEAIVSGHYSPQCILAAFESLARVINKLPRSLRIGDLHGKNVIVEGTGDIHIIDIDGFSICPQYVMTCPISGLHDHVMIQGIGKYWDHEDELRISKDTDIFCFFLLFLRWIMQSSSLEVYSPNEVYRYFSYLERTGFPREILDMIYRLFEEERNILVPELLQEIDLSELEKYQYRRFVETSSIHVEK